MVKRIVVDWKKFLVNWNNSDSIDDVVSKLDFIRDKKHAQSLAALARRKFKELGKDDSEINTLVKKYKRGVKTDWTEIAESVENV